MSTHNIFFHEEMKKNKYVDTTKVFPDSYFVWLFLPTKPCSGLVKVRGKGPEWCIYNQSKMNFIYLWLCILIYICG